MRKYCKDCLTEYRIASTANECKKCKNRLNIEFEILMKNNINIINDLHYSEYVTIYNEFISNKSNISMILKCDDINSI